MSGMHAEDRQLAKRLLAHDALAFKEFFDTYFARLYRFACARLNDNPEAVKEVVHATLSRAIQKLHTYRGEAALFTWLCTICRNQLSEFFKRQARERQHVVLTEDFPEIRAAVESFEAPESDSPEARFQRVELARLIQVALDRLPAHYGNALEWKYIYGYSVVEIAERLGLGREATHSVLARAKRAFHDVYKSLTEQMLDGEKIHRLS